MKLRKKILLSGAAVPRMVIALLGSFSQALNWENRLPARKLPRNTVITCADMCVRASHRLTYVEGPLDCSRMHSVIPHDCDLSCKHD